jgi:hypothetical protein
MITIVIIIVIIIKLVGDVSFILLAYHGLLTGPHSSIDVCKQIRGEVTAMTTIVPLLVARSYYVLPTTTIVVALAS